VDQVVRDSRVLRRLRKDAVQDPGGLLLGGVGLVRRRDRAEDRESVEDPGFAIVRVLRSDALHRGLEGEGAGAVIELVGVAVEGLDAGDVVALPLRLRPDLLRLRDRLDSLPNLGG
jgi:hypothetical protein